MLLIECWKVSHQTTETSSLGMPGGEEIVSLPGAVKPTSLI